jgi:hypothetical protein
MDIGQCTALVDWFADGLQAALPDGDIVADIKALPQSLRIPATVRLQGTLDTLRNVVATLSFALIDLGLEQPV